MDPSYKDEIITEEGELQEKYRKDFKQLSGPYLNTEYLGFNLEEGSIVQDIRIRKALDMGFDREKMLLYLRNGMGSADVGGMIPKGLEGNISLAAKYNPTAAKELLESYKKETGNRRPTLTLATNASYLDIAEFLQREWQKIGIDVQVDVSPPATLRQEIATGKVAFLEGVGLLIIRMQKIIYRSFTLRIFRLMVRTIRGLKTQLMIACMKKPFKPYRKQRV